ncbi:MAG TPA: hypothetical protein VFE47_01235 [Tepidisphaeraceae bacterium]|jgi:hypothetical protein|nr:hypothetical protein [Tepidisphaeraceae bacterium]
MDNDEKLKFLREEIRFENSLIMGRVGWIVTAQSFLVSPLIIAGIGANADRIWWIWRLALPILGMILCLLILPPIWAGRERIEQLRDAYCRLGNDPLPPRGELWYHVGQWFSFGAPILFFCFWTIILIAVNLRQ